jgi:hypothetical protein
MGKLYRLMTAVCDFCKEPKADITLCSVLGCNAGGDRERRSVLVCADCRKRNKRKSAIIVNPCHKTKGFS